MQTQIKEWGNSQGIRLPKEVLKSAGFTLNEEKIKHPVLVAS